jgi:alpha-tubulin suppressor-like RCC1 family protein
VTLSGGLSRELIQIALTDERVCGIRGTEREVVCSQVESQSDAALELKPMANGGLRGVLMLSSSSGHFCAVTDVGQLYCWGKNESYQFGQKQPAQSSDPVLITLKGDRLRKVSRVTTGEHHTCVTTADDPSLYCFGQSLSGGPNSPDPVDYPL